MKWLGRVPPAYRCWPLLATVVVSACDHTAAYDLADYGGGPRVADGRLDGVTGPASWTGDGNGVLTIAECLVTQTVRGNHPAPAVIVVPTDGRPFRERCERDLSLAFPADSSTAFWTASMTADGRIICEESVSVAGGPGYMVFPAFTHTELWLTDSAYPFAHRRRLLTLYHDSVGVATVADNVVNWLLDVRWVDDTTFVAMGFNLPPRLGVYAPRPITLVRGRIGPQDAAMSVISGTDGARAFSALPSGDMLVFSRDSLIVEQVPLAGGAPVMVAALPPAENRLVTDISCNGHTCLLLTQELSTSAFPQSTYWTLSLSTGAVTLLKTVSGTVQAARLSPTTNTVLVEGNAGWALVNGLVR